MEQLDALKAAALADPVTAAWAAMISLALLWGVMKIILFNSRRKKLLAEYGELETI
ncbi:MAG: hypothetical protein HOC79_08430, partial [Euryarchaeota archaeon]|nr:hypothetical protein [Euryarchaeota archaeon]